MAADIPFLLCCVVAGMALRMLFDTWRQRDGR